MAVRSVIGEFCRKYLLHQMLAILLVVFLRARAGVPSAAYPRVPPGLEAHPRPANLADARALHVLAANSARRVRGNSGHASVSPPSRVELAADLMPFSRGGAAVVRPTDFGADATGQTDSTAAFEQVLQAFANVSAAKAALPMAAGIRNMGGWTLDLSGGTYLISSPLVFPDFNGNYHISEGTLRASSSFPSDRFVIEVGTEACTPKDQQQVCSESIVLNGVFVDGGHKAAGCVRIDKTMGTTFGPSAFCTGFSEVGIRINGGHETMVVDSWVAAYYWGEHPSGKFPSAAIEVNGQDNYLSNVVIFGAQSRAVLITGGVNVLSNVHSWGGPFVINGGWTWENRILNCLVDFSYLEIVNPSFTVVADTFFLNSHTILRGSQIKGVTFQGNIYSSENQWGHTGISNIELVGDFKQGARCDNVVVNREIQAPQYSPSWKLRTTRARLVMHKTNAKWIHFDFSSLLLFPWIDEITYSVTFDSGAPLRVHGALPSEGTTVSVRFHARTSATVTMDVVQCPKRSDLALPATYSDTAASVQPAVTNSTEAFGNLLYA
eukprot:TRINITY_DN11991_c0_g1_i4.p1 TRINITY_DN11991_c0_g1~~TRINITY_DN11991_c0_g1_i4.p1  ORF type:complete len:550 (-),score=51.88 TRINITY_DN11991_c0_g1_i4:106-1755(-)